MISAIAAVDENWGIGFNGELLEKIPEDLKFFKDLTLNNTVIMGRKTWESLPNKKLNNRFNIVITRNPPDCRVKDGVVFLTKDEAYAHILEYEKHQDQPINIFIIGGGQIYNEFLNQCDDIYITRIFKSHKNVDTYFPTLGKGWIAKPLSDIKQYNDISYQFWHYSRNY